MFLVKDWEMFYTDLKSGDDDDFVDQISIDIVNKRFILDERVSFMATDGYDVTGEEIASIYLKREIFDVLLAGLIDNGYKRIGWNF